MATGRTTQRWLRVYMDGYPLASYATNAGPLAVTWEEYATAPLDAVVRGVHLNRMQSSAGVLNTMFDDTATSGGHVLGNAGAGSAHNLMFPLGIRAEAAIGDPVFMGRFLQADYMTSPAADGVVASTWRFGGWDYNTQLAYGRLWGNLLHAYGQETAVNTSTAAATIVDNGAASSAGGWLMYQINSITGASGSCNVRVQDSADGSSFTDLSGATSGTIAYNAAPTSGIVQLLPTATVRRYLRWQITLTTVTAIRFVLAFVRGNGV